MAHHDPWSLYTLVQERDPALIYQDVVVALDEARGVNNGSPALHAHWLHVAAPRAGERVAHIGAGAGYYSAFWRSVTAVEYDTGRSASARENLKSRLNVDVIRADGRDWPQEPTDVIYVNFAVARPATAWIDNLTVGGRLIFLLGVPRDGPGLGHGLNALPLMIERRNKGYAATSLGRVAIVFAEGDGGQSDEEVSDLQALLERGGWEDIKSLIWNAPVDETTCWLKGDDWALSFDDPQIDV